MWKSEEGNQKEEKKMGKQFNYYISPEEDIAFTKELIELGYCIMKFVVVDKKDDAYMVKWEKADLSEEKEDTMRKTFIYKEEWGTLRDDIFVVSDIDMEPVIEQVHCEVWETTKKLGRGRIYLNTVYKDEIASFDAVEKDFRKIVRLVKKLIAHKEYTFADGRSASAPLSDAAVKLVESGNGIRLGM